MQPIRKDFRPTGGAYNCDYRPPLLTNGARYFAGNSNSRPPGPIPGYQRPSPGSRAEVSQPTSLPVGVTAHVVDARGHQTMLGALDQASEKAEAEKYTALFSRMLQENILLSGASNPTPTSLTVSPSTTRQRLSQAKTGHLLTGSGRQRYPRPVAPNQMSFRGPCPTTRNLAVASNAPIDLLGWTSSSQGLTTKNLPLPPPSMAVLPPSVGRHVSVAPPGYLHAPAALPIPVPPVSQYHPLSTTNNFNQPGLRWSTPTTMVPAPVINAPVSVSAGFGQASVVETSSKGVPEVGFLTKNLAGLHSTDILSRVNQMLAKNLFDMTTENPNDSERTVRSCSHDSRSTYSSSRGRSEDGGGGGRRRRSSDEEQHRGSSRTRRRRSRRRTRSRSRRSRSSYSSSSSAQSTASSVLSAGSSPQYNKGRNYRNRRDKTKPPKKRKPEFCRICEIKIKGSFLAHRRGKAHIGKELSVQGGCDLCSVRCFNTYSEYEAHRSSEEHLQKRTEQQNQIDADNRKKLGLPENKIVIIRNPDGKEQEEELAKLGRLRKMARDRDRISVAEEEKQEEEQQRPNGNNLEETELDVRSSASKDGKNSPERNAGVTNRPGKKSGGTSAVVSPLRGCYGDQRGDVVIDLTGKSEEEGGKRQEDQNGNVEKVAAEDKDDVTRVTNHTLVTSTTADKAAKDDCLGREWVVPVTGFFCKVCLKFFSANSGESDVLAHCTSARHRDNYHEQVPKAKRSQASSSSPSSSFSPPSSSSSTLVSPPNAGRCGIVYDENKQVKEIIIWKTTKEQNS